MKRRAFIIFMIVFTVYIAVVLFVSLICGAPMGNRAELFRYLFGAIGMSMFLPAGFTFFFINTLDLSKKIEEMEADKEERVSFEAVDTRMMIGDFVNTLSRKNDLTQEKRDALKSYLEDYR